MKQRMHTPPGRYSPIVTARQVHISSRTPARLGTGRVAPPGKCSLRGVMP
jgi:hypothetical protein